MKSRLDERRAGLRNRFGSFAGNNLDDVALDTLAWLDFTSGQGAAFTLPDDAAVSEPVLVPRSMRTAEANGWLLAVAWRYAEAPRRPSDF